MFGCAGLRCCMQASSTCVSGATFCCSIAGCSLQWLLVVGHRLCARASAVAASEFLGASSVVLTHGLDCSMACGIFPDQGLNPALPGTFLTTRPSRSPRWSFHVTHHLLCSWGILDHDSAFDKRFSNLSLLQHHLKDFIKMMAEPTQEVLDSVGAGGGGPALL